MADTIAILNSNEDVLEMLRYALEKEGFNTVTAHVPDIKRGNTDLLDFIKKHDPTALIYDVAPPYSENWTFLQLILDTAALKKRSVVVTTANKRLLQSVAGGDVEAYEISEKPYSIEGIVTAVKRAAGENAA